MRLLVDECLHTSLIEVAHEAGYVCDHVNACEYTFVTNDRVDFAALYGREEIHTGLVIIVPSVVPKLQRELFRAALAHIGERELVNTLLEVDLTDAGIACREFLYPGR
jgi:hypothetical protein